MTPKEKAIELYGFYVDLIPVNRHLYYKLAKLGALKCVSEIDQANKEEILDDYWVEVEREIIKL